MVSNAIRRDVCSVTKPVFDLKKHGHLFVIKKDKDPQTNVTVEFVTTNKDLFPPKTQIDLFEGE